MVSLNKVIGIILTFRSERSAILKPMAGQLSKIHFDELQDQFRPSYRHLKCLKLKKYTMYMSMYSSYLLLFFLLFVIS